MPPVENLANCNVRQNYANNFGGFDNGSFLDRDDPFAYQQPDRFQSSTYCSSEEVVPGQNHLARFAQQQSVASKNGSQFRRYTVQPGDTVYTVLLHAGHSKKEIAEKGMVDKVSRHSGVSNPNVLRPGQNLNLPCPAG